MYKIKYGHYECELKRFPEGYQGILCLKDGKREDTIICIGKSYAECRGNFGAGIEEYLGRAYGTELPPEDAVKDGSTWPKNDHYYGVDYTLGDPYYRNGKVAGFISM